MRLRVELRARWRAWGVIAMLIGVAGGAVLTTAAGARRTDTAYGRYLRYARAADVVISPAQTGLPRLYGAVAKLPQVAAIAPVVGVDALAPDHRQARLMLLGSTNGRLGTAIERPKLTEGRVPRSGRADEAVADRGLASALDLHAGSRLRIVAAPSSAAGFDRALARAFTFSIVGVGVFRDNVVPVNALASQPTLFVTPALLRQLDPRYNAYDGAFVRLRPGASRPAFARRAEALAREFPETGTPLFVADEHEQAAKVEHAIRPQAAALVIFSLLAAVTALIVIGQIVSRQLFVAATENPTLRALGMDRSQLVALGLAEVGVVAIAGTTLAVAAVALASPLMPIGPARVAEPHPGFSVNWAILGLGGLAVVVVLFARAGWPAWRLASAPAGAQGTLEAAGADRPSRVLEAATRAGAPVGAAMGVRFALEPGRGRTAVPVRSALAGTILAIVAVAAAFTFGTNLVRFVDTPRLYGQTWDLAVDTQFGQLPPRETEAFLRSQRAVAGWTFGDHGDVTIAGHDVPTIGLAAGRGTEMWPVLLAGRPAARPGEIVLGTKTLQAVHREVGETIAVTPQGESAAQPMRIVGRAVFPFFGRGSFTPTGLGEGAAIQDLAPDPGGFNFVLVRITTGADHAAAVAGFRRALARAHVCPQDQACGVNVAQRPVDVVNYARIQATPLALATVLALLGMATVAHLLLTSIRRRRRDLAVLKALGFVRGQVFAAVAWQATTLVGLALLVGLPLGVAAGRWTWQVFAGRLGAASDARVPVLAALAAVPVAVAIANAVAVAPGLVAGRLRPATVLRDE